MHLAVRRRSVGRSRQLVMSLVFFSLLQMGCGPEEYQKPIQQFQDASNSVISTTRAFLNNMNVIEQNAKLDNVVFQKEKLDLSDLEKIEIISPEEIRIRTQALDALTQYTSNLAELAQGKAGAAVGDNTTKLSSSLKGLAEDAKKLPAAKGTFFDNAKFSGIVSGAASAIGAVAQLIVEHKARREIETSIEANDAAVTLLIQQISDDAAGAYLRQKSQLGAYGDQLSKDYQVALNGSPDPILLLSFAKTLKSYRTQSAQLTQANPGPAIEKMKKAHESLVAYVKSSKNPKTLAELVTAVQEFVTAAKPLGQAVQSLISAS
jgi:hypothetical protein